MIVLELIDDMTRHGLRSKQEMILSLIGVQFTERRENCSSYSSHLIWLPPPGFLFMIIQLLIMIILFNTTRFKGERRDQHKNLILSSCPVPLMDHHLPLLSVFSSTRDSMFDSLSALFFWNVEHEKWWGSRTQREWWNNDRHHDGQLMSRQSPHPLSDSISDQKAPWVRLKWIVIVYTSIK